MKRLVVGMEEWERRLDQEKMAGPRDNSISTYNSSYTEEFEIPVILEFFDDGDAVLDFEMMPLENKLGDSDLVEVVLDEIEDQMNALGSGKEPGDYTLKGKVIVSEEIYPTSMDEWDVLEDSETVEVFDLELI